MIRLNNNHPKVMELTSFKKKDSITDEELIKAVLKFESLFLAKQKGVIFHCLVRNFKDEYANIMFVDTIESLKKIENAAFQDESASKFFSMLDEGSEQMTFHNIEKENFEVPQFFSCIECGTFSLKNKIDLPDLLLASETIEKEYLSNFENTKGHFIGTVSENLYSEVTFGETFGKTSEICSGYLQSPPCQPLLKMADETSMKLDFWYLIA